MTAVRKIDDERLLDRLTRVFQAYGYEGASLSRLTTAGGLKRASLYHRFPGGKEEIASAVLDRADKRFAQYVLAPLAEAGDPARRVRNMAARVAEYYEGGRRSCLLDTLSLGEQHSGFRRHIRESMSAWVEALEKLAREAGLPVREAARRAEEAVVRIQGALILSRATGDTRPFQRVLAELPDLLTGDETGGP